MTTPYTSSFDISALLETDMTIPLDTKLVQDITSHPPFIPVSRALNLRDIGLIPGSHIPPGLIYRSGSISSIPPSALVDLGIKLILDLRSEREILAHPNPQAPGIQNVHIPTTHASRPLGLANFKSSRAAQSLVDVYMEILEIYAPAFKFALQHIRDTRTTLLFHCTAGKDRTGVLAALILCLADTSMSVVKLDYGLTRVGVEGQRGMLEEMMKAWGMDRDEENEGDRDGWKKYIQVKDGYIVRFLEEVGRKYGSVEGWIVHELGWEESEVVKLKSILRGEEVGV